VSLYYSSRLEISKGKLEFPMGWGGWRFKHVWNKMFLEKTHVENYITAVVVVVSCC